MKRLRKYNSSVSTPSIPAGDGCSLDHIPSCRLRPCPKMGSSSQSRQQALCYRIQRENRLSTSSKWGPALPVWAFHFLSQTKAKESERGSRDKGRSAAEELTDLMAQDMGRIYLRDLWLWGEVKAQIPGTGGLPSYLWEKEGTQWPLHMLRISGCDTWRADPFLEFSFQITEL